MSNRTAKFASAICVGLLAGVAHTPMSSSAAYAADDCLAGPKGETPAGGHWYYRIDRATKRHCWYMREENEKLSRVAPSLASPSAASQSSASLAKPVLSRQETVTRSIADAHAELPLPQTRIEAPSSFEALGPAKPADTPSVEFGRRENTWDTNTQTSVVASRWPAFPGTNFSANTAFSNMDAPAKGVESTSPTLPPPVQTTEQVTATDVASRRPTYSVQQQLAALLGMLALAGFAGSATLKFGNPHNVQPGKVRARQGAFPEPTNDDTILLSAHPQAADHTRRTRFARDLDRARRNDRIAEFFSHLSKHAPT